MDNEESNVIQIQLSLGQSTRVLFFKSFGKSQIEK